jgi:hypothetical protein
MSINLDSLRAMIQRYQINKMINYETVIPIKILFLDLLHHLKNQMEKDIVTYL